MAAPTTLQVRRALPWITLGLAAAGVLAFFTIDRPIGRFYADHGLEARAGWLRVLSWIDRATGDDVPRWTFILDVHKWFVAIVLVAIGVGTALTRRWRGSARVWFFATVVHVVTRLGSEDLKPLFGRLRPSQWVVKGDPMFFAGGVSFPSGYAAFYFGIVAPFAVAWPRVGIPLLIVPCFVAWSRVAVDAHFVSDVIGSAVMTGLVTWIVALGFRIDGKPGWRR